MTCTPKSILEACLTAAQIGLEPNRHLGEGYFIPFWSSKAGAMECQFQIGYKGIITLARNSGEISMLDAQVVYTGDTFEYEYGLDAKLRHIPGDGEKPDADITHAWAMVKYKDGSYGFVVLSRADIEKRRKVSKQGGTGPWVDWYPEMCRKTAIRALSSFLPKSVQKVVVEDQQTEITKWPTEPFADVTQNVVDVDTGEVTQPSPETEEQLSALDAFAERQKA